MWTRDFLTVLQIKLSKNYFNYLWMIIEIKMWVRAVLLEQKELLFPLPDLLLLLEEVSLHLDSLLSLGIRLLPALTESGVNLLFNSFQFASPPRKFGWLRGMGSSSLGSGRAESFRSDFFFLSFINFHGEELIIFPREKESTLMLLVSRSGANWKLPLLIKTHWKLVTFQFYLCSRFPQLK